MRERDVDDEAVAFARESREIRDSARVLGQLLERTIRANAQPEHEHECHKLGAALLTLFVSWRVQSVA